MTDSPSDTPSVPADGILPPPDLPIRLDVFEGPLDLLLFLIRKNEIDIYDIPIEKVTQQYLEILRTQEKDNLELAGDFFVMAATLMYIKSRMLLPVESRPEEEVAAADEGQDPRWALVQQLIQYKRVKETAAIIRGLVDDRQGLLSRHVVQPQGEDAVIRPVAPADRIELWNTFNLVLRRLAERIQPGNIASETVTVSDRMETILARLETEPTFVFTSLLPERPTVGFLVATFLACLELARLGKLKLEQDASFAEINCAKAEPNAAPNAGEALEGGSEFDQPAGAAE
ncbi:MAG: chromosome segregation protein ScpA [Verrucomicrobia bacterium]|nr:chromosome segregation protein ScpA [Verrucomicrobiota bacterium]